MHNVCVVGSAQLPVKKRHEHNLRQLGATAVRAALDDAGRDGGDGGTAVGKGRETPALAKSAFPWFGKHLDLTRRIFS
jgi:hypothetical protein